MAGRIIDVYILDERFRQRMCIDYYISMNWTKSLFGDGECELIIPIRKDVDDSYIVAGNYISRADDDMICQIQYVEVQTGMDGADTLLVKAADITKMILNKRIVWVDMIYTGSIGALFQKLLDDNFSKTAVVPDRRMISEMKSNMIALNIIGTDSANETFTYKSNHENVGDVIAQVCETYRYGMLLTIDRTEAVVRAQSIDDQGHVTEYNLPIKTDRYRFVLNIFRPTNRSNYVIFADNFDNIIQTNYTSQFNAGKNLILVGAGEEDDGSRYYQPVWVNEAEIKGFSRDETFVDASNIKRTLDWQEILKQYPMKDKIYNFPYTYDGNGGYFVEFKEKDGDNNERTLYYYRIPEFKIPIESQDQLNGLLSIYANSTNPFGWQEDPETGYLYFYVKDCDIAIFTRDILNNPPKYNADDPDDPENEYKPNDPKDPWDGGGQFTCEVSCVATDVLYTAMIIDVGYQAWQPYTEHVTFSAEIDPEVTFKYKRDYILGDYVSIRNKYYVKAVVQVIKIMETIDSSGYHFDMELSDAKTLDYSNMVIYCATDAVDAVYLLDDETGKYIVL